MRTWMLSTAVLGMAMAGTGAGLAQAKATPAPAKASPAPAKDLQESCEFQVRTRSKVGYRGTATYYVKGPWLREEKRSGGGMELILVNNDKGFFIRNKHAKYWFRYPEQMGAMMRERLLGGPIGDVKKFLKKVYATNIGKEKVEGALCNIWAYRVKGADDKFKLWTDLTNTKPIRMERDHKVGDTNKRDVLVVEYKRYLAGKPLSDSLFQLPAGEKVHDLRRRLFGRTPGKKTVVGRPKTTAPAPAPPAKDAPGAPTPVTPPTDTK